jgi:hypothetical protein
MRPRVSSETRACFALPRLRRRFSGAAGTQGAAAGHRLTRAGCCVLSLFGKTPAITERWPAHTRMLNPTLLQAFCDRFYGYGTADAPHWFISMEEGGGTTEAEIGARVMAWDSRGRRELEEVDEFHNAIDQSKWFGSRPPIQRTWAAMIRMLLAMDGESTDTESVRIYQRDRLARRGGTTRLTPLFPLPAQSLNHWHYANWSTASHLRNRSAYRAAFESSRVAHLGGAVTQHAPRTVAFFGLTYLPYWSQVAGTELHAAAEGVYVGRRRSTKFIVCKHPATRGIRNDYFVSAAQTLSAM